jgi:hypothetical protein
VDATPSEFDIFLLGYPGLPSVTLGFESKRFQRLNAGGTDNKPLNSLTSLNLRVSFLVPRRSIVLSGPNS